MISRYIERTERGVKYIYRLRKHAGTISRCCGFVLDPVDKDCYILGTLVLRELELIVCDSRVLKLTSRCSQVG
jgi:hypothetical protein